MRWLFFVLVAANIGLMVVYYVQSSRENRLDALNAPTSGERVIAGAPLVLVSELSDQQRKDLAKPKSVAPAVSKPIATKAGPEDKAIAENVAAAPKGATGTQCLDLGPIPTAVQAEQISHRLMALRIVSDMVDRDAPGGTEYWVILPPYSETKQALQKLRELEGRAIPAQIIPKGELMNAISFGLHGQQADADKQAKDLNSQGFKAQVRAMPVMLKQKWLALSERQTPKINSDIWDDVHKDFPFLEKHYKKCQ